MTTSPLRVRALATADHARWLLANDRVWGFGAHLDGQLVGITHYLFHTGTWNEEVCYLQDLFVDPAVRGRGVARALIEAVAKAARARCRKALLAHADAQCSTRVLYDKVARHNDFIRYDYPL